MKIGSKPFSKGLNCCGCLRVTRCAPHSNMNQEPQQRGSTLLDQPFGRQAPLNEQKNCPVSAGIHAAKIHVASLTLGSLFEITVLRAS